jgi:hypothetical protein
MHYIAWPKELTLLSGWLKIGIIWVGQMKLHCPFRAEEEGKESVRARKTKKADSSPHPVGFEDEKSNL